jgi:hypothetical protein
MNNTSDDRVGAALRRSTTYGVADRLRALVVSAVSNSRVNSAWQRITQAWAVSSWSERRRAGGTLILVASAWHVLMVVTFGDYASGLVFALPAIAGFIGALAILSASPFPARR